jgi:predicted esterase
MRTRIGLPKYFGVVGLALALAVPASAQPPGGGRGGFNTAPDPRVEQRTYQFEETNEEMRYALFVSSKVSKDEEAPLIVALHGLGGDGNSLLRGRALELAEEGGYILVGPMGYNPSGWFGSPVIVMNGRGRRGGGPPGAGAPAAGGAPAPGAAPAAPAAPAPAGPDPETLARLSEADVMNVIALVEEEFTVDEDRTYLMGHSMGGAGSLFLGQKYADNWAAVAAIAPAAFMMQANAATILTPMKNEGVPVLIIQGDADTVVPPENTRAWAAALESLDMEGEYIELAGGDHGSVIGDGMPEIFELFEANER